MPSAAAASCLWRASPCLSYCRVSFTSLPSRGTARYGADLSNVRYVPSAAADWPHGLPASYLEDQPRKIILNNPLENEVREFALAALAVGATMVAKLTPEAQRGVDSALKAGAHLELAFGPLPAFQKLSLVLVEVEGRRHTLCVAQTVDPPRLM